MNTPSRRGVLFGLALLLAAAGCLHPNVFNSDVDTAAKPWTHLDFRNDPDAFQFAIVSDRTGGARAGIFESAVGKLNLLQPEFVICVGDLIEGYTEDEAALQAQWDELNGFVRTLDMPFFYAPGNHDNVNPTMARVYREQFGRSYYSFVYKRALFMVLDTQDTNPTGLGTNQVAWAVDTLRRHPDVRWTFLLMHQPLWVHEEGGFVSARKNIGAGRNTGFGEVEKALAGRDFTVIAGHFHQYIKFLRQDRTYVILGSTGGASQLRGPGFGEFDHAVWVTLKEDGPVMANLLLDGILREDVHTESHVRLVSGLQFKAATNAPASEIALTLPLCNPFHHKLHMDITWILPANMPWTVEPAAAHLEVPTGTTNTLAFTLRYAGTDPWPALPRCEARLAAGNAFAPRDPLTIPWPAAALLQSRRPTVEAPRAGSAPAIDGKLDDAAWSTATPIEDFRLTDLGPPPVRTTARVLHDATALYFSFRCEEPNMAGLRATITERDGNVWQDDDIEILVGTNAAGSTYWHFAANGNGALYDANGTDRAYTSSARTASSRDANGWSMELAIPWADLGGTPPTGLMSLALVRARPQGGGIMQHPPLNGSNHRRELHGFLRLVP